jgi:hypothetical protein
VSRDFSRFPVPDLNRVAQLVGCNPRVTVFVPAGSGELIVCPTAEASGGLYLDQSPSALLPHDIQAEALGQNVWEALLQFRSLPQPVNLKSYRKTDWPAFRASGSKTVRQFEAGFVRVSVEAFPCTLRVEADVLASEAEGVFVGRYISNACQFEDLGELIRLLCRSSIAVAQHVFPQG